MRRPRPRHLLRDSGARHAALLQVQGQRRRQALGDAVSIHPSFRRPKNMLGMGDYDSCTEKYFRICSRAPIPDMHIAREPGIQLLRLQAAIAGSRTYFCARGASM